jgi:hypothetical protein
MLNEIQLFEMAKQVGLTHREVLTGFEFFGMERTKELIKRAFELEYFLEFDLVPIPEPPGQGLTYRLTKNRNNG